MPLTRTPFRLMAFALAVAIAGTLLSTIVGSMPPEFALTPAQARNATAEARTEVAIVPARIEVIGLRSSDTAASDLVGPPRPRS